MAKVFLHDQTDANDGVKVANAKLTVNCPSGSTVNATLGEKHYTTTSDASGRAVFTGLCHGEWRVSIIKDSQTKTANVNIVTDYDVTIDFFTAAIRITYPAGSVCTCSNGDITYTAPDLTGKWTCDVPRVGVWTITCSDGYMTKTMDTEITYDGERVDVAISYVTATINVTYPNGAICSCSNGIDTYSASDTTGHWSFVVYEPGSWMITATDNIQTVTEIVTINYDGQVKDITIKFFAATINVTYPAGAKCTCSDGITTYTASDADGSWTITVPRAGIWTIKATRDSSSVVETVEITEDGQNVSVTCEFFISYINVTYPSGTYKVALLYVSNYGTKVEVATDTSSSGSCRFVVGQTGEYEICAYRVIPYVGIEGMPGDYDSASTSISGSGQTSTIALSYNTLPAFTYTGIYNIYDDDDNEITESSKDWNIEFYTSGALRFTELNGAKDGIDVFVVGGGGDGGSAIYGTVGTATYSAAGGGGGGGYRSSSFNTKVSTDAPYEIIIGAAGGNSSAFGTNAGGGSTGGAGKDIGDSAGGGDGGTGGSNGGKGGVNAIDPQDGVDGQYAFLGNSGIRYAPGGAGGYGYNGASGSSGSMAYGGSDGGGDSGSDATENSGGGGGGQCYYSYGLGSAGKGGSGIVIIRNRR